MAKKKVDKDVLSPEEQAKKEADEILEAAKRQAEEIIKEAQEEGSNILKDAQANQVNDEDDELVTVYRPDRGTHRVSMEDAVNMAKNGWSISTGSTQQGDWVRVKDLPRLGYFKE